MNLWCGCHTDFVIPSCKSSQFLDLLILPGVAFATTSFACVAEEVKRHLPNRLLKTLGWVSSMPPIISD
ncbi:hypothetical protein TNCV_4398301 [Trichonephila clavipes]|nr:hypothetical protein TNCV_4398301 [Trichonephila clavipes]